MHKRMVKVFALLAIVFTAPVLGLQVTLTDVDGTSGVGELVSLSPEVLVWKADGTERETRLDDLAKIAFHTRESVSLPTRSCVLYPRGGGRLNGSVVEPISDGLVISTRVAGQMKVPFSSLRAIAIEPYKWTPEMQTRFSETMDNPQTGEDILLAKSEKAAGGVRAIHGALLEFGPGGGEFRFNNRTRRVRTEKVIGVVLAASLEDAPLYPAEIRLNTGDELRGSLISIDDNLLSFMTSLNQTVSCKIGELQTLTLNNDRIVYLDALDPRSQSSSGIVHTGWTFRANRNVFNQPMRLDATEFDHGIGVHAHSEIQYRLDGAYETFAATLGIDDAVRPGGNVRFKVLVDGELAFDSGTITGADRAKQMNVTVTGAQWMTLIVETAEGADIGDWANWAAARLIKPSKQS